MDDEDEGLVGFNLIMPFVVCASVGDPFDDDAFTAGFTVGTWYERLEKATPGCTRINVWESIRTALIPQFDLIAMKFGWKLLHAPVDGMPEWSNVTFEKGADDGSA